jgi:hypothetical protein
MLNSALALRTIVSTLPFPKSRERQPFHPSRNETTFQYGVEWIERSTSNKKWSHNDWSENWFAPGML